MGILKDILFGLVDPYVAMVGIGMGIFWLTQPRSTAAAIGVSLLLINLLIFYSKFQVETAHGAYNYQLGWVSGADIGHPTPLLRPDTIPGEQYHLVFVQLSACLIWAAFVYFGVTIFRRRAPS